MAIVDSGDCRSRPITGNKSDERRKSLHGGCEHIFANENRAILRGDSCAESLLLGFRASSEHSATNFSKDCNIHRLGSVILESFPDIFQAKVGRGNRDAQESCVRLFQMANKSRMTTNLHGSFGYNVFAKLVGVADKIA